MMNILAKARGWVLSAVGGKLLFLCPKTPEFCDILLFRRNLKNRVRQYTGFFRTRRENHNLIKILPFLEENKIDEHSSKTNEDREFRNPEKSAKNPSKFCRVWKRKRDGIYEA